MTTTTVNFGEGFIYPFNQPERAMIFIKNALGVLSNYFLIGEEGFTFTGKSDPNIVEKLDAVYRRTALSDIPIEGVGASVVRYLVLPNTDGREVDTRANIVATKAGKEFGRFTQVSGDSVISMIYFLESSRRHTNELFQSLLMRD